MGVNWAAGLMRWRPHVNADSGVKFPLNHLHPFRFELQLAAAGTHSTLDVEIAVGFSMHVFTRGITTGDDPACRYVDGREARTFDVDRYNFSRCLPGVLRTLDQRKCYHAKAQNFLTLGEPDGLPAGQEYQVYFDLKRWKEKEVRGGRPLILLVVQSAYAVPFGRAPKGRRRKPVSFRVLLNSAVSGRSKPSPPPG